MFSDYQISTQIRVWQSKRSFTCREQTEVVTNCDHLQGLKFSPGQPPQSLNPYRFLLDFSGVCVRIMFGLWSGVCRARRPARGVPAPLGIFKIFRRFQDAFLVAPKQLALITAPSASARPWPLDAYPRRFASIGERLRSIAVLCAKKSLPSPGHLSPVPLLCLFVRFRSISPKKSGAPSIRTCSPTQLFTCSVSPSHQIPASGAPKAFSKGSNSAADYKIAVNRSSCLPQ